MQFYESLQRETEFDQLCCETLDSASLPFFLKWSDLETSCTETMDAK